LSDGISLQGEQFLKVGKNRWNGCNFLFVTDQHHNKL